jgi:hypothetical protein
MPLFLFLSVVVIACNLDDLANINHHHDSFGIGHSFYILSSVFLVLYPFIFGLKFTDTLFFTQASLPNLTLDSTAASLLFLEKGRSPKGFQ